MDRGAYAWVANTKPPFEQGLRAEGAEQRDVHQGRDDPPDTEAAGEGRVNLTKQALSELPKRVLLGNLELYQKRSSVLKNPFVSLSDPRAGAKNPFSWCFGLGF